MSARKIKQLEIKVESIHKRLRRVEADLEMLPTVTSFDEWTTLTERDRRILAALPSYGFEGASTLQLAKDISLNKPKTSGRTIVLRRLYRIQKVSTKMKGAPLVLSVGRKWSLNFDDFSFALEEKKDENQD